MCCEYCNIRLIIIWLVLCLVNSVVSFIVLVCVVIMGFFVKICMFVVSFVLIWFRWNVLGELMKNRFGVVFVSILLIVLNCGVFRLIIFRWVGFGLKNFINLVFGVVFFKMDRIFFVCRLILVIVICILVFLCD